jgi:hypothetical protein
VIIGTFGAHDTRSADDHRGVGLPGWPRMCQDPRRDRATPVLSLLTI